MHQSSTSPNNTLRDGATDGTAGSPSTSPLTTTPPPLPIASSVHRVPGCCLLVISKLSNKRKGKSKSSVCGGVDQGGATRALKHNTCRRFVCIRSYQYVTMLAAHAATGATHQQQNRSVLGAPPPALQERFLMLLFATLSTHHACMYIVGVFSALTRRHPYR